MSINWSVNNPEDNPDDAPNTTSGPGGPNNDDEDIEDETLPERLLGLAEMFPEPVTDVIDQAADFLHYNFKNLYWFSRQSTWIVETCTLILLGPILLSYCGWKRDAALDPGPCGGIAGSCRSIGGRKCHLQRPTP
ncbi:mitochondrial import receptor subunit TOM22 homolog [Nilaparvata lugens]|uniref:mitochondrial import receptor subunit TOM22 homolog n=1 Tax=Nilaparvata lugens TaxID=108931 RepID=UPI000B995928|nr:mitochondrial import receptor subunit TOM22 homolog [Nilaparvata lugens]XP_039291915.1 mitochondrial import receptor subunit TOM22 homolog [Nilaparvata lugens]